MVSLGLHHEMLWSTARRNREMPWSLLRAVSVHDLRLLLQEIHQRLLQVRPFDFTTIRLQPLDTVHSSSSVSGKRALPWPQVLVSKSFLNLFAMTRSGPVLASIICLS